jgi:hypothetical protein
MGTYGHGDAYASGQTAGGFSYSPTCSYFYTCLGVGESVAEYEAAVGLVGGLKDFGRRYRFEVHGDTTLAQFEAALTDPAFAR